MTDAVRLETETVEVGCTLCPTCGDKFLKSLDRCGLERETRDATDEDLEKFREIRESRARSGKFRCGMCHQVFDCNVN